MPYVYSTISNDVDYAVYRNTSSKELSIIDRVVTISGKANVATKKLITPKGVVTEVSEKDLEFLLNDFHFKEHMAAGFVCIEKREHSVEKVIKNMTEKDRSAPKTPDDYPANYLKDEGCVRR